MWPYMILDWFFIVFHTVLILFNVFGWLVKRTRKLNLITLTLTAFSWFALGAFYGFGYCFLTDWHWKILAKLSSYPVEHSYIQYLLKRITGIQISANAADRLTVTVFVIAFALSLFLNVRDIIRKRRAGNK
jgi:hypothetical protein